MAPRLGTACPRCPPRGLIRLGAARHSIGVPPEINLLVKAAVVIGVLLFVCCVLQRVFESGRKPG